MPFKSHSYVKKNPFLTFITEFYVNVPQIVLWPLFLQFWKYVTVVFMTPGHRITKSYLNVTTYWQETSLASRVNSRSSSVSTFSFLPFSFLFNHFSLFSHNMASYFFLRLMTHTGAT